MNTYAATEEVLVEFTPNSKLPASKIINDDVMGGISTSTLSFSTNRSGVFSGVLSLENNGGFASVRISPARKNLRNLDTFVLRVRGDGQRYKFNVRTKAGFDTPTRRPA